jgi:hypothetical protein
MCAPLGLAARECVVLQVEGVAQVIDAWQHRTIGAPVGDHAADRDAAEADAVIGALAADQPGPLALAARHVIGQRDLERGIHRLRPRVYEEHPVQVARHLGRDPRGELEYLVVAELEGRREVQGRDALLHRRHDLGVAVAEIGTPQAGRAVEDLAAVVRAVMHALGADHDPGVRLELAIGRERQPQRLQIVRRAGREILFLEHPHLLQSASACGDRGGDIRCSRAIGEPWDALVRCQAGC